MRSLAKFETGTECDCFMTELPTEPAVSYSDEAAVKWDRTFSLKRDWTVEPLTSTQLSRVDQTITTVQQHRVSPLRLATCEVAAKITKQSPLFDSLFKTVSNVHIVISWREKISKSII